MAGGGGCVWQGSWARCVPSAGMWEGPEHPLSSRGGWALGRRGGKGERSAQEAAAPPLQAGWGLDCCSDPGPALRVQCCAITDSKDLILSSLNLSLLSEAGGTMS